MALLRVFLYLYQALYALVLVFLLPRELFRCPSGQRLRWLKQRAGFINPQKGPHKETLWIHAVSVGEALAAGPLVEALRDKFTIYMSTVTHTGQEVARRMLPPERVLYAPFDLGFALRGYLKRLSPQALVVMETELWPCLYWTARRTHTPLVLVNGRLSERSLRGYLRIRPIMKRVLGLGSCYCMQTRADARRLISVGAPEEKVLVTGNIKLDITPPEGPPEWASALGHPLLVAGSTHEGEERLIIDVFRRLKERFPELVLLIAPRHPERFAEVEALIRQGGFTPGKRSEMDIEGRDVVLLDSIGELMALYAVADICIVGGSFVPVGGHNLFEPACWGRPIITGPHMENFPLAEEFFVRGAALKATRETLYSEIEGLLISEEKRQALGNKAREVFLQFRGAKAKTLEALERVLQTGGC